MSGFLVKAKEPRDRHELPKKTCSMLDEVDCRVKTDGQLDGEWEPAWATSCLRMWLL